jgi:hypothetical protein
MRSVTESKPVMAAVLSHCSFFSSSKTKMFFTRGQTIYVNNFLSWFSRSTKFTTVNMQSQRSSSSSDEDDAPVSGAFVVRTRGGVVRARRPGSVWSVAYCGRGRPFRGTWGVPRGVFPVLGRVRVAAPRASRRVAVPRASVNVVARRASGRVDGALLPLRSSGRGGGRVGASRGSSRVSVISLERPAKRPHSPSSDEEDVICLGQVAPRTDKLIHCCVPQGMTFSFFSSASVPSSSPFFLLVASTCSISHVNTSIQSAFFGHVKTVMDEHNLTITITLVTSLVSLSLL